MRKLVPALLAAVSAFAAGVDGRWVAKVENRKKGPQEIVFNLKAEGERLVGTVATGRRMREATIQDGKITGDQISFATVTKNRKTQKDNKLLWTATLSGNELKGTSQPEGRGRGRPFTAVRQQ
jgi:hypothetical protein